MNRVIANPALLRLRREFFPEVDAGAFEIYVRAPSGTRIEVTEAHVARVEQFIREKLGDDLELEAVERVFGDAARGLAMSSTKSAPVCLLIVPSFFGTSL